MYQIITSHSRYGTVTDQVRHYRNCSSRNLFWHKKQRYVCLLIRTSYQNLIPGHLRKFQRIVKEGPSIYRRSHEIFIQELPMSIPEEVSYKHQLRASSRSWFIDARWCEDLLRRISTGSPQDLLTRTCTRSCKVLMQSHRIVIKGPALVLARIRHDLDTITSQEHPRRAFIQAFHAWSVNATVQRFSLQSKSFIFRMYSGALSVLHPWILACATPCRNTRSFGNATNCQFLVVSTPAVPLVYAQWRPNVTLNFLTRVAT